MGWYLIFAASESSWITTVLSVSWTVLLVLIGVNMLIIVHELGHFIVARMCGVKCEKFYIWFDIFGCKLGKFRWGETEYGLGVLPLGGYVKMLGQEDNPARLKEELERAKAQEAAQEVSQTSPDEATNDDKAPADRSDSEAIDIAAAEAALYDPRSYLAQSVPKRMTIISAGVIMNVLFAFVVAAIAYQIGVFEIECGVGGVVPGEAAWHANLRVGDRIDKISGNKVSYFNELLEAMVVGEIEGGVALVIDRPGVEEPLTVTVRPDRIRGRPTIGVVNPYSTTLWKKRPVLPGSPADLASSPFQGADTMVQVDDEPIESYVQFHRQEALHPEKTLKVTVERAVDSSQAGPATSGDKQRIVIEVGPRPMRRLGLVMKMGPIVAVQPDSPAAEAGIRPGDLITNLDGQPVGDPMTLADRLRKLADEGREVTLTVSRKEASEPLDVAVRPRQVDWYDVPITDDNWMSSPAMGIVYQVANQVDAVERDGPAAKRGIKNGDEIIAAKLIPPDEKTLKQLGIKDAPRQKKLKMELDPKRLTWPVFFYALQSRLPGTRVELQLKDGRTVQLEPVESPDWFHPDRGLVFKPEETFLQASSLGQAVALGGRKTLDSLTMVFRFLRKLGSQVSPRQIGGPIAIVQMAYGSASSGMSDLLIFLCLISANLAVLNILPIPILDGGHMVFLTYEGIRGKPPSERVFVGLSYLGLLFILGLMIWVVGLDVGLIPRN